MKKRKKTNNPVAKFAKLFNKSIVMTDRKKEMKKSGKFVKDKDEHIHTE